MVSIIEYLGIPGTIGVSIVALYLIMQLVGELIELCGKVVPEFFKIRKYFKRKKEEKQTHKDLLKRVNERLESIDAHYSTDNITKRNKWMEWVNNRAEVYDSSVSELTELKEALHANNELTLDLYINFNRNRIIDFASKVINENVSVSREEFFRIFKIYDEYEAILEKHNKTNGEVEVSMRIIKEAYETHMRNHTFIEDIRGYNK